MLFRLIPAIQQYAWGKVGSSSKVAQLLTSSGEEVESDKPYAELWMGTHVNGAAKVEFNGKICPLSKVLVECPELLSIEDDVDSSEGLPYLFKILSVKKALSIQAHPNLEFARELHQKFPDIYKDANHKPEMTLALTPFEALVGFKSYAKIFAAVEKNPELHEILEEVVASKAFIQGSDKVKLQLLFETLMHCDAKKIQQQVDKLSQRLSKKFEGFDLKKLNEPCKSSESIASFTDRLALRLIQYYPGDVGVFCVYFLNYKLLNPGEAMFLAANEPHAYLQGDCAEIMATSDNVVRAGLTPKLRDVDTLCSMLTYTPFDTEENLLEGAYFSEFARYFSPTDSKVGEFAIEKIELPNDEPYTLDLRVPSTACVVLMLEGSGILHIGNDNFEAKTGTVFLQGAGSKISVTNRSSTDTLILLRATTRNSL